MKQKMFGVVGGLVLAAALFLTPAKSAFAATYCIADCEGNPQLWCSGGAVWQVTSGDEWYFLYYSKSCIPW